MGLVPLPAETFPFETVREVARLLQETDLSEISLETIGDEPQRLVVRRAAPITMVAPTIVETAASQIAQTDGEDGKTAPGDKTFAVKSAAVGLYRAPAAPLEIGALVTRKTVLGVVEAMKVPTEIHAAQDGKIVEILVKDGQGVEWGQPLILLEPTDEN